MGFRQIPVAQFSNVHLVSGAASVIRRVFTGGNRAELDLGKIARLLGSDHAKATDIDAALDTLGIPVLDYECLEA